MSDEWEVSRLVRDDAAQARSADGRDRLVVAQAEEQNRLLAALSLEDYERLLVELRPVRLDLRQVLIESNAPIANVWFIRSGVGSMIATMQDGGIVEVGTVGNEGLVGVPLLHGLNITPYSTIVQIAGDAWRMDADVFVRLVEERAGLRHICLRFAQYFADQAAQSVACNRLHTLEERCARWLLMTHDRVEGDQFELIHEFLSMMLGVRRAGVTVAMGTLQRAGILSYLRGQVTIVDRARLEEASCDCYKITHDAQQRLFSANARGARPDAISRATPRERSSRGRGS